MKKAGLLAAFWIGLALLFNAGLYFFYDREAALNFLTGYLIEKSLSIDNLFVFIVIFKFFQTPRPYQSKVLFWGILGAIMLRALFIFIGIALFSTFHWISYLFGAFLIYAALKMALPVEKEIDPSAHLVMRLLKRWLPVKHEYVGDRFFVKMDGSWYATLLFVVLLSIETTDLFFALDSIPAILAITQDPFIVLTSNIFAILGLRSLYFVLEQWLSWFHLLHYGLALILAFAGCKMLLAPFFAIPPLYSLAIIFLILLGTVAASMLMDNGNK